MVGDYPSAIVQDLADEPLYETREAMLAAVNATRAQYGLQPVALRVDLSCAALTWSKRIWRLNICGHVDPQTGQQFWQRVTLCGGRLYSQSFEIVACGYPNIASAITGWLNSPPHRQALLNPYIRTIGVGAAGPALKDSRRFYTIVLSQ